MGAHGQRAADEQEQIERSESDGWELLEEVISGDPPKNETVPEWLIDHAMDIDFHRRVGFGNHIDYSLKDEEYEYRVEASVHSANLRIYRR